MWADLTLSLEAVFERTNILHCGFRGWVKVGQLTFVFAGVLERMWSDRHRGAYVRSEATDVTYGSGRSVTTRAVGW